MVLTTSQKSARTSLDGVSLGTDSPSAVDRRAARALDFLHAAAVASVSYLLLSSQLCDRDFPVTNYIIYK